MTLDEIRNSTKMMLTPSDVAEVLGCDAQSIRINAKIAPERLGFPVIMIGNRVKIPKLAFIRFITGE